MAELFTKYKSEIKNIDEVFTHILFKENISVNEIELIRNKKKQILVEAIGTMLSWFPQLNELPVIVFLFGSYARNSNRCYSDIDLSFVYPDEYFEALLPIEEIICLCLSKLFGMDGRDKVHSMGCMPLIRERKKDDIINFALAFNDGNIIRYKHSKFTRSLMNEIFNMTRDLASAVKYLNSNNNLTKIIEWNASISPLHNNTDFDFNKILDESDDCVKSPSFKHSMKLIVEEMCGRFYNKIEFSMDYTENIINSNFKKLYKTSPFDDIYSIFSMLRLFLKHENYNIGHLRIDAYLNDEEIKGVLGETILENLKTHYYHYYIFMSKVDYVFKVNKVELSSQAMNVVDSSFFLNYEDFFRTAFRKDALANVKNIYHVLLEISKCLMKYLE
jgi:predicted nucleotidyltransferase